MANQDFECTYGEETRKMVEDIGETLQDLRNHYSQRLPPWGSVLISVLTALLAAAVTWGVA